MIVDGDHERVCRWVLDRAGGDYRHGMVGIGQLKCGELIAGVCYEWYQGDSILIHIRCDSPPSRRFLWFIFYYPFDQIKVSTLYATIAEDNVSAIDFAVRCGASILFPVSGRLVFALTKDKAIFLKR